MCLCLKSDAVFLEQQLLGVARGIQMLQDVT